MGRYYWSKRDTVEGSQNFTIGFLKEHGYLDSDYRSGSINWSRNGEPTGSIWISSHMGEYPYITLDYTITEYATEEKRSVKYDVNLVSTPCNFGGKRWWFQCWNCMGRTATLYKAGHDKFLCRRCNNMAYDSQNKNRRGVWYQVGKVLDHEKLEKLPQYWGKYEYYRGRPTRNYLRALHSTQEMNRANSMLELMGWYK